jgi:hypothetical protein
VHSPSERQHDVASVMDTLVIWTGRRYTRCVMEDRPMRRVSFPAAIAFMFLVGCAQVGLFLSDPPPSVASTGPQ